MNGSTSRFTHRAPDVGPGIANPPFFDMNKDFRQNRWDASLETELKRLLEIAVWEDSETLGDLTSRALVPLQAQGAATIHAREKGILAGCQAVPTILAAIDWSLRWSPKHEDGATLQIGTAVGTIHGPALKLLTAERIVLNLMGRLSGIATLTRHYVEAISGTSARIYDTRKTTLGWRRLEKYAVHCGGGTNHRTGLFDAVLIKDNHLAFGNGEGGNYTPADAVIRAKKFVQKLNLPDGSTPIVEIEVDTLEQLAEVLPTRPDIVLLDNMPPATLKEAVAMRNRVDRGISLEASGGINLQTVRAVAESGVDRISVGALTHSAISLDLGLDWNQ